jgi:hypothetical protein
MGIAGEYGVLHHAIVESVTDFDNTVFLEFGLNGFNRAPRSVA